MKRNAIQVLLQCTVWLLWVWLAFAYTPAFAAIEAVNKATIAPPVGVVDTVGGCDAASPPNCTGNNAAEAKVAVWAATQSKSASPMSGSTVVAGQTITYTLSVEVTGGAPTTAPIVLTDTLGAGLTFPGDAAWLVHGGSGGWQPASAHLHLGGRQDCGHVHGELHGHGERGRGERHVEQRRDRRALRGGMRDQPRAWGGERCEDDDRGEQPAGQPDCRAGGDAHVHEPERGGGELRPEGHAGCEPELCGLDACAHER
ncbi:DUF11 domain-containing protein [Variovorax paradoxus]|nr:DUF11 domain-containing protein [Variovorax paradoxus]